MITNKYGKNPNIYITESVITYFISILTGGAFLATILNNIGVSDSAKGIISSLASLGVSAQFLSAIFLRPKRGVKKIITSMNLITHLMFAFLYIIPYIKAPGTVKTALFAFMFLGSHMLMNAATPFKHAWFMSGVTIDIRGRFSADREIVSLVAGMFFSYSMGMLIDHYEAAGKSETGFILSGLVIFTITIIHMVILLYADDDKSYSRPGKDDTKRKSIKDIFNVTLFDKGFQKLILVDIIWHIGSGISVSFFGSYQINELGFSLRYVAILSALYTFVRVGFSRFFGKMADKSGWTKMLMVSIGIGAFGFLINTFTAPSNGRFMYACYYFFFAIYSAGVNSAMANVVFDYVKPEDVSYAIGIKSSIGGIGGFLASLFGAWVVGYIQANGLCIFGTKIYAQQVLSFVTFIIFSLLVLFIKKLLIKRR